MTRFLLLSDSCWFVDVGRCLWREDGSLVYNCCWPLSAQSFSGLSPVGVATKIRDFPFRRLVRLAGLRWRYSTPPPHGILVVQSQSQSQSYVKTDGQSASLSWNKAPIGGLRTRFLSLSDSCGFLDVGRSLFREDGSFARVTVSSNKSVVGMYNLYFTC
jgi:hypothetical protein